MLELVFWDVQHGSAVYIKTPSPKHIVQDLGIGSYKSGIPEFSPLRHLKYTYGVNNLDEVIITHPHRDHLDDIENFNLIRPSVLSRPRHLTDEEVWAGNRSADAEIIREYLRLNNEYIEPVPDETNPLLPANNGGVDIKIFVPKSCGRSNLNNHSIVTVVSYEDCKVILPGDNEPPSWQELLTNRTFINAISGADVLLAPHHGRESGFCSDIFDYFEPYLTIISDGRFADTSATSRYSQSTRGWKVHRRNGQDVDRKCVTTRNDGVISVRIGRDRSNGKPFISVTID